MRILIAIMVLGLAACSIEKRGGDEPTVPVPENDVTARLDYFELPAADAETVAKARDFYAEAFGWDFTDFAPVYAATTTGDTDIGLSAVPGEDAIDKPLPVIQVSDLEAALDQVEAAGGRIARPIFAFPGGRRFHAVDPAGNEIAVWVVDENETGE